MTEPAVAEFESELDPRDELAFLVRSLRAHLEWQGAIGTSGLPRDPDAKQRVAASYAEFAASKTPARDVPPTGDLDREPHKTPREERSVENAVRNLAAERSLEPSAPKVVPPIPKVALPVLTKDLGELREMVKACTQCALHEGRTESVFSRGTGSSRLMFIGEAPGEEEDKRGEPFVGPAGQLLDKMIEAMGFSREEVYVANIVKCRPPGNRKPDPSEMAKCRPYLEAQIESIEPEYIVALGATALTGLYGPNEGITKARGRFRTYRGDVLVMPTFHPSYLLRVPSAKKDTWADLLQVVRAMGRTPKSR